MPPETAKGKLLVPAALLAVYLIWGSTYYAMRVALTFLPPFLMAGPRFILAGGLIAIVMRWRGSAMPTAKEWAGAGLVGVLLHTCGNGFVAVAQRTVDSGVAATVAATVPLWAAAIGSMWGDRPSGRELLGLLAGFAGVAVLHRGGNLALHGAAAVLLLAPITWALGSVLARRLPLPRGPMAAAAQMIVGGISMCIVAALRGERPVGPPTASAIGALVYLIVFGSIVGHTSYVYLLRTTRPAVATSYAYVNPLIALLIGALFAGERFTVTKLVACLLTVAGVVVVNAVRPRART